jgi:hypothetical protein
MLRLTQHSQTINTVAWRSYLLALKATIMCFSNDLRCADTTSITTLVGSIEQQIQPIPRLQMGNSGVPFLFQYTASGTNDIAVSGWFC